MATYNANRRVIVWGILIVTFFLFVISVSNTSPSATYGKISHAAKEHIDRFTKTSKQSVRTSSNLQPVFIDLGANKGDSLRVFLREPGAKWSQEFPKPFFVEYSDFHCYLFEANPVFTKALEETKEIYANKPKPVKIEIFPGTIVGTEDGYRDMMIDTTAVEHDFWGSSVYNWAADGKENKEGMTRLPSVNFSKFLLQNFKEEDYVVVKMDIEGAEYEVIPHLVETGAYKLVDVLMVEWHTAHPAITDEDRKPARAASIEMTKAGIFMPFYDSPA